MTGRDLFNVAAIAVFVAVLLACFGNWEAL